MAREGRRTTIIAKDVLGALRELDFEDFLPSMEAFLEGYRREERCKKEEKEAMKMKQQAGGAAGAGPGEGSKMKDATTGKFVGKKRKLGDCEGEGGEDDDDEEGEDEEEGDVRAEEEASTSSKTLNVFMDEE